MTFRKSKQRDLFIQAAALLDRGAGLPISMQLSSQSTKWLDDKSLLLTWSNRLLKMQRKNAHRPIYSEQSDLLKRHCDNESNLLRPSVALQQEIMLGEENRHVANY